MHNCDKQKQTKLVNLPPEILVKICKHLLGQSRGLEQLRSLVSLKKTCKRLQILIDSQNFNFGELVLKGW